MPRAALPKRASSRHRGVFAHLVSATQQRQRNVELQGAGTTLKCVTRQNMVRIEQSGQLRERGMRRMTAEMCWLIFGTVFVLACAQPASAQAALEGAWTATRAERDGKAAHDLMGHRLSFTGNRFEIRSKDGRPSMRARSASTRVRSRRRLISRIRKST